MTSALSGRVRVVATGVSGLARLITKGSPLNNLEGEDMAVLPPDHADALMSRGFGDSLPGALRQRLLELSGGHPWILQCLLGNLWEDRERLDEEALVAAVARFVRNRDDVFVSWIKSFGDVGKGAFGKLASAPGATMAAREWRSLIPREVTPDSVLRTLSYHGVICETDDGRIKTNGSVFRDWFNQNVMLIDESSTPASEAPQAPIDSLTAPKSKRVFVVFGRDRKLYSAVVRFLRTLKLDPVEWNDALDGTKNASASIKEILDEAFTMAQAVVVLLTPDDEARLRPAFHGPQEPAHETQLTVQPRPNVLFEAGFAMARFPKATILVRFDRTTRLFSDIGGVYLLDLSNEFVDREHFVRRLKTCGLDVDDSGTEWHTKERGGDFTPYQ
jgi:predicted nucleotide-binding protein